MRLRDESSNGHVEDGSAGLDQLIARAKSGSSSALGRALDACRPRLLRVARKAVGPHLRNQVGASDVVQETFASATRGFGVFRGQHGGAFFRWLRQILSHRVADIARRGGRSTALVERSGEGSDAKLMRTVSADISPSAVACEQEYAELIRAALARLSQRDQQVLRLRFEEQLTFPQIAERCRLSADGARMLFVRAVKRLQRELPVKVEL